MGFTIDSVMDSDNYCAIYSVKGTVKHHAKNPDTDYIIYSFT